MEIIRKQDEQKVRHLLDVFPVVTILGSRQCGKTFLAHKMPFDHYFDLENPRDQARLREPQLALERLKGLIVIDEVQRSPELFPLLRYLVDQDLGQRYLILGSASLSLIRQSSESLAGRVGFYYLGGLGIEDVGSVHTMDLWFKGGYPQSFLAPSSAQAMLWLQQYIATFVERDLPQLGSSVPAATMRRFWVMLGHYHGQVLNYSELGRSFGMSDMSIRRYIELLEATFMVRILHPWHVNVRKRLQKRPKVYVRDPGLLHALMTIETPEQLLSHNKLGASWEGFALEQVVRYLGKRDHEVFFWGTHSGAEVDLFWQTQGKNWGIEFKYRSAPEVTRSMKEGIMDLELEHLWVIYPGDQIMYLSEKITALPLSQLSGIVHSG